MDLEVRHLRLVHAIESAGSLTGAGKVLHLTQSALSHQLCDIESRLGVRLFRRAGRRLIMTTAGERLLASAREVLEVLERTERTLRGAMARRDPLRITVERFACYHWLPDLLRAGQRQQRPVEIDVEPAASADPARALVEGAIDIAIVSSALRDPRLVHSPLFDDRLVVLVTRRHRLADCRSVPTAELAREHVLAGSVVPAALQRDGLTALRRPPQLVLTETLLDLVKADLGVAVVPEWTVAPSLKKGVVRAVPVGDAAPWRWTAAMTGDAATRTDVRAFVDLLTGLDLSAPRLPRTA